MPQPSIASCRAQTLGKTSKPKHLRHGRPSRLSVHADELKIAVAKRIEAKQSFGNREGKIKVAKKEKAPVMLHPEQIPIPTGVFAQEGGEPMEQVPLTKLSPHNPGVAVASIDEALQFIHMQRPSEC